MRKLFIIPFLFLFCALTFSQSPQKSPNNYKVFHTSVCFDLLSSFASYEELLEHSFFEHSLAKDSVFISEVQTINDKIRPSNICNFYASLPTNKDDIDTCLAFFLSVKQKDIPDKWQGKYIENVFSVLPQIQNCIRKLIDAGFEQFWEQHIFPKLENAIVGFSFKDGILDQIHSELIKMSGNGKLNEEYSKIYILDIDNAFSLNDETFCCTYLLLDKELAEKYRINFIQVYIHENLHRLYLSKDLMNNLEDLFEKDPFFNKNESIARNYGEGQNEAFIVAAECYISRKLGLKTDNDVFVEFSEYVDGSLVLAPIIYNYLSKKKDKESMNDFISKLFKTKKIKAGKIEKQYKLAMKQIKAKAM